MNKIELQSNKKSETDRVDTEKVSTEQQLDTQVTNESWQCADLNDKFEENSNDIYCSQNVKSYGAETVGDDSAFLECHFLDEN